MCTERAGLSRHAAVAKAMDYMLKRWDGFARFLDDGRICPDQQRRREGAARYRDDGVILHPFLKYLKTLTSDPGMKRDAGLSAVPGFG